MEYSLRNDQKFIQSVILYEVNNWKPVDEICENLRKLGGDRFISKSCSFPELSVESLKRLAKAMDLKDVDSIQKDKKFIRYVILYEFLISEKNKYKIYKKLLRRIGSDVIDYTVFSHWYNRFKSEYFDIEDESLDSKAPTFSDLPMDVIVVVVEKSGLKEQLSLRKVSRNLRSIVDKQKPAYKNIEFYFNPNRVYVKFNGENVMYCDTGFDVDSHKKLKHLRELNKIRIIKSSDYIDTAYNDIAIALKNPKLQLESLEFKYAFSEYVSGYENAERFYEKIGNLLGTLNYKISIKEFRMMTEHENHMLAILPYLKPGELETIRRTENYFVPSAYISIDEIVTLDQWKHTKCVSIDGLLLTPIEKFLHLNRFMVNFDYIISIEDLIRIRDELLTSNEFQYCELIANQIPSFAEINRVFNFRESVIGHTSNFGFCPIPNSQYLFKFEINHSSLFIERISRYESYYFDSFDE